ncbi:hypothetical protein DXA36_27015 [Eisenbergiella sp. OF01-20]|nr:hypothetical protein DXA36_27015 [Eisenbergiella sp. OF01-20]
MSCGIPLPFFSLGLRYCGESWKGPSELLLYVNRSKIAADTDKASETARKGSFRRFYPVFRIYRSKRRLKSVPAQKYYK